MQPDAPLKFETWQREILEHLLSGKRYRRVMINAPRWRSPFARIANEIMMHQVLYGCDVQVLDHDPYWRCTRAADCPQIQLGTAS